MDLRLSGCILCGDDYNHGDQVRVWQSAAGPSSCHDACYLAQMTDAAKRAKRLPLITAASVTTFDGRADARDLIAEVQRQSSPRPWLHA